MNKYEIFLLIGIALLYTYAIIIMLYDKKITLLFKRSVWYKVLFYAIPICVGIYNWCMIHYDHIEKEKVKKQQKETTCRCCGKKI